MHPTQSRAWEWSNLGFPTLVAMLTFMFLLISKDEVVLVYKQEISMTNLVKYNNLIIYIFP